MPHLSKTLSLLATATLGSIAIQAAEVSVSKINERFFTTDQSRENIDSPATWHSPSGEHLLLATSKEGHSVNVFDATNGAFLRRVGGQGIELGQFDRPNGIWVEDNYLFVVERDNRRVQVLLLPSMQPLATFGESELEKPYGLYVRPNGNGEYTVWVTDSFEGPDDTMPADTELDRCVHQYLVETDAASAESEWEASFGATEGAGRLFVVESIYGDPTHDQLLVAEELEDDTEGRQVKVYDFEGNYTGTSFGQGIFANQVEGIALYQTSESEGYWIVTDQSRHVNLFHVFRRGSFEYIASIKGNYTLNTDGIWLTQTPMPGMPQGAFFACDNDKAVAAFDFADIIAALGLE